MSESTNNKIIKAKAGDVVIKEGELSNKIYLLKTGQLTAYKELDDSRKKIGIVNEGEIFGEMAFINNIARTATLIAQIDSEILVVTNNSFQAALDEQPEWLGKFIKTLINRLKKLDEKS